MVYEGLLVHDLRRSGVRNLARAGVSETVARRISGHKTREIFSQRYYFGEGFERCDAKTRDIPLEQWAKFGANFRSELIEDRLT
jgi:hypothetical protein